MDDVFIFLQVPEVEVEVEACRVTQTLPCLRTMNRSFARPSLELLAGILIGVALSASLNKFQRWFRQSELIEEQPSSKNIVDGVTGLIGKAIRWRSQSPSKLLSQGILLLSGSNL